ncbi:hypothetical protein B4X83_13975 [Listeria monocytogenes]|nr:hypothetical protein [Listeria monocytogenes]EAC8000774.1 hypothetical protein [Listeria monocytogenes]EAC9519036.1 hypothetical protein [Listeria monocytogenes]EAD0740477.1 hypothetical protein [Listeria monocytogenes]EAD7292780.1 hypothetical protein [Listeria monocytogenes]
MNKNIIIENVQSLLPKINIQAIIQHGSSVHKELVTDGSDIDILVVSETAQDKKIIEILNSQKYHIDVFDLKTTKRILLEFENSISKKIFDTNSLSGRLLSGNLLLDNCFMEEFIKQMKESINTQKLILKFYLQSLNFIKDFQHQTDEYSMKIIFDKALDSIGTAILLKHKFYNLNPKHQIKILKIYLSKQVYQDFIDMRFTFNIVKDKNNAFQKYKQLVFDSKILEGLQHESDYLFY